MERGLILVREGELRGGLIGDERVERRLTAERSSHLLESELHAFEGRREEPISIQAQGMNE
jgi:hypothetical protein